MASAWAGTGSRRAGPWLVLAWLSLPWCGCFPQCASLPLSSPTSLKPQVAKETGHTSAVLGPPAAGAPEASNGLTATAVSLGPPLDQPLDSDLGLPRVKAGLTLEDALRECLQADPKLQAAAESINLANAELWTASLLPNPTLITDQVLNPLTRPFTATEQGG